ncbi:MAG: hypothetical protein QOK29_5381 [Rhodospirillaceae bacterium]|jgi:hypothetical protein|nr:hypothetical protein [Rhodospirillaceae bacterium]
MRLPFPVVVVGSLLLATAAMADSVPKYDMARTCRLDHAAASGLAVTESMKNCVRDEKQALGQLQKQWSKFPAQKRAGCVSQNTIGGTPSYVGLLTCLQF